MTRPGPATRERRTGPTGGRAGRASAPRGGRASAAPDVGPAPRGSIAGGEAGRVRRSGGRRGEPGPPPDGRFAPAHRLVPLRVPDAPLRARVDPLADAPDGAPGSARHRRGGPLRRFVRAYGWRAYALPLLTVLTVLCVVDAANGSARGMPLGLAGGAAPSASPATPTAPARAAPPPAPEPTPTGIYVDDPGGGTSRPLPPTALPPGPAYTRRGAARFEVVPGSSRVVGTGPLKRYTVEVEAGVAADGPAFAAAVESTLGDRRSWGAGGRMSFQRVDGGPVDFRVSLTASLTVRKLCGYTLSFETSCYNGQLGRAVINDARWVRGAVAYAGDLAAYRLYVINHEVGHALGHDHEQCPRNGALAPVMMQQTLGVQTAGGGRCRPNPWPSP